MTKDQRGRIAEKIMEWGNLVFAGLVIGQFVTGGPPNVRLIFGGMIGMLLAYLVAIIFMKKGK